MISSRAAQHVGFKDIFDTQSLNQMKGFFWGGGLVPGISSNLGETHNFYSCII